jgi:hypothetical protein
VDVSAVGIFKGESGRLGEARIDIGEGNNKKGK